ncbi:hypothetical protein [Bacillus mycoides]|uniref:hypothetical protein n=1 Tax=Bacillus mycoides TaxID=1405 RepID=UPI001C5D0019|nr:hypothetical protein [Bacillus mycoides]
MNVNELRQLCEEELFDERIKLENIFELQEKDGVNYYSVNNKVAIPIEEIAFFYERENDIDVLDSEGKEIGRICFRRQVSIDSEFTDYQLIAFAFDVQLSEYRAGKVSLEKDYLVIQYEMFNEYLEKYFDSAPVWGNFSHQTSRKSPYSNNIEKIIAEEKVTLPTEHHKETIMRAIQQPFGFERFLKSYHMLELLFDLDLVNEIQTLGSDLKGIGKIMQEYSKKEEIYRLQKIVSHRCKNFDTIASILNRVKEYIDLAKEIFFDFGKESNPIKPTSNKTTIEIFDDILSNDEPFEYENLKSCLNNVNNREQYNNFILKISTYFIYRVRCSIAHHKIGEYMMSYDDEEFVVEFAEPLLKSLIIESFREERETAPTVLERQAQEIAN